MEAVCHFFVPSGFCANALPQIPPCLKGDDRQIILETASPRNVGFAFCSIPRGR